MLIHLANLDDQLSHIQQLDTSLPKNNASLDDMWPLAEAVCEPLINPLPYLFNPGTWDAYADALGGRYEDGKLKIESIDCVWRGFVGLITGCLQESNSSYPIEWKDDSLGTVGNHLLGRSSLPSLDAMTSDQELHYLLYTLFATRSMKTSELGLRVAMSDGSFVERFSSYWKAVLWFHCSGYRRGTVDYARAAVESESKPGKRRHALLLWWEALIKKAEADPGGSFDEVLATTEHMVDELTEPCEFRGSGRLPVVPLSSFSGKDVLKLLDEIQRITQQEDISDTSTIAKLHATVNDMCGASAFNINPDAIRNIKPLRVGYIGGTPEDRRRAVSVVQVLTDFSSLRGVGSHNQDEVDTAVKNWVANGEITPFTADELLLFEDVEESNPHHRCLVTLLTPQHIDERIKPSPLSMVVPTERNMNLMRHLEESASLRNAYICVSLKVNTLSSEPPIRLSYRTEKKNNEKNVSAPDSDPSVEKLCCKRIIKNQIVTEIVVTYGSGSKEVRLTGIQARFLDYFIQNPAIKKDSTALKVKKIGGTNPSSCVVNINTKLSKLTGLDKWILNEQSGNRPAIYFMPKYRHNQIQTITDNSADE